MLFFKKKDKNDINITKRVLPISILFTGTPALNHLNLENHIYHKMVYKMKMLPGPVPKIVLVNFYLMSISSLSWPQVRSVSIAKGNGAYLSHNHRSPQASYLLTQHGFHKVINMTGGMNIMTDKACVK